MMQARPYAAYGRSYPAVSATTRCVASGCENYSRRAFCRDHEAHTVEVDGTVVAVSRRIEARD